MKCEICGNEMKLFHKDSTSGWNCTACGNSWLTTSIRDINSDMKEYELTLKPNNEANLENIKLVAKISKCSFIEARNKISNAGTITRDRAAQIQKSARELQDAKVKFTISPDFPYSIRTGEKIEH